MKAQTARLKTRAQNEALARRLESIRREVGLCRMAVRMVGNDYPDDQALMNTLENMLADVSAVMIDRCQELDPSYTVPGEKQVIKRLMEDLK